MRSDSACGQSSDWTTRGSAPASRKASANIGPHSGERGECFTITAFPASTAGTTTFTAVSSG
jgi:hypothetical protein